MARTVVPLLVLAPGAAGQKKPFTLDDSLDPRSGGSRSTT
jgi:hypothetical protein